MSSFSTDVCVNKCIFYTGDNAERVACSVCCEPRFRPCTYMNCSNKEQCNPFDNINNNHLKHRVARRRIFRLCEGIHLEPEPEQEQHKISSDCISSSTLTSGAPGVLGPLPSLCFETMNFAEGFAIDFMFHKSNSMKTFLAILKKSQMKDSLSIDTFDCVPSVLGRESSAFFTSVDRLLEARVLHEGLFPDSEHMFDLHDLCGCVMSSNVE